MHWSNPLEDVRQLVATNILHPLITGILYHLVPAKQPEAKMVSRAAVVSYTEHRACTALEYILPFLVCQGLQLDFRVIKVAQSQ